MPEHPEAPDRWPDRLRAIRHKEDHRIPRHFWEDADPDVTAADLQPTEQFYLRSTPTRLAAEQMLEALERISYEHPLRGNPTGDRARAAIAAAQGEKGDTT